MQPPTAGSTRSGSSVREPRYASGESRYKVYIIDEAHMLTNEACNAFLKNTGGAAARGCSLSWRQLILHVFPPTIVSRCQRFDFHLLTVEQIGEKLRQVARR